MVGIGHLGTHGIGVAQELKVRVSTFSRWFQKKIYIYIYFFFFKFSPLFREDFQFDYYFLDGLVQPPTSFFLGDIPIIPFHTFDPTILGCFTVL